MKKVLSLILVVLFLVSIFAACNPSNSGSTTTSPNPGATTDSASPDDETPAKDSLVIGIGSEFSQIAPLSSNVAVANRDGMLIFALYDPLIWRDPLTGELQPCIAERWEVSDDGLEYTLYLRDDVTFHNGTPMTAEDVAWTINLLPDAPAVSTQNYPGFNRAEVVDENTVKIIMDAPFAAMLNGLAAYHIGVLSKDYFDEVGWEAYAEKPIGTGPYMFVSRTFGAEVKLEANDNYWGEKANIKNITFRILPDTNSQMIALETGEVDVMYNSSIQNVTKIDKSKGFDWQHISAAITCAMSLNMREGNVLMDENLRKAVLCAINYDGINQTINQGYTTRATCLLPPGTTGRPEDGTYTAPYDYDVDAAKQYLAASDYDGTTLRLLCIGGSKEENILTIILGDLATVGINAEVIPLDGSTFMTYLYSGEFEVMINNMMPSLFDANLLMQMHDPNTAGFELSVYPHRDYLAELGQKTISEMNPDARKAIFAEMTSIINENAYSGYIYYDILTIAYNDSLKNIQVIPSSNYRICTWSW